MEIFGTNVSEQDTARPPGGSLTVPWHMQLTWRSVWPKQCMVQLIQHGTTTLNAFNSFLAIHKNFLSKCYQLFIGHKITFSKF